MSRSGWQENANAWKAKSAQPFISPTQAKSRFEWATRQSTTVDRKNKKDKTLARKEPLTLKKKSLIVLTAFFLYLPILLFIIYFRDTVSPSRFAAAIAGVNLIVGVALLAFDIGKMDSQDEIIGRVVHAFSNHN